MKSVLNDQRERWLDIARGLGIIFVMIGHTQMYTASFLVYIFHMPMFFFISGYFFSGDHYDGKTFLFWMTCIFYLLLKWTKHNLKKMCIISFIMILIAALYYALGGGSLPGNIDIVFTMMIFYLAGYTAKQKAFFQNKKLPKRLGWWTILSFVIALAAGLLNLTYAGKKWIYTITSMA